jgi:hypothetical protein
MTNPSIPDVISVVGSAYLQPITDLLENLLKRPISGKGPAGSSEHENGYSSALVMLLIALIESYTARLRFVRHSEWSSGNLSTPELLKKYFPTLENKNELIEVFLIRNVLAHNHIWHMDVSDFNNLGAPTLATPKELGFHTNKNYEQVVNIATRATHLLELNINPTSVDRTDVLKVFKVIWGTLKFMNAQNYGNTPLAGSTVRFRKARWKFEDLLNVIKDESEESSP